jgi:hypothetical protein
MNRTKTSKSSSAPNHGPGLIPPAEMFERALRGPFAPDAGLPFDERVERAWAYIKATRFTTDEHERLREVLAGIIVEEARNV